MVPFQMKNMFKGLQHLTWHFCQQLARMRRVQREFGVEEQLGNAEFSRETEGKAPWINRDMRLHKYSWALSYSSAWASGNHRRARAGQKCSWESAGTLGG